MRGVFCGCESCAENNTNAGWYTGTRQIAAQHRLKVQRCLLLPQKILGMYDTYIYEGFLENATVRHEASVK